MKKLYWRMYLDKNSIGYNSVVLPDISKVVEEAKYHFQELKGDPPVFEPVMMSQKEFDSLSEFDGF